MNSYIKNIILPILVLFSTVDFFAQNESLEFSHLTIEDGLSTNRIAKIVQDSRGFIWIGTSNGLNRFDGYNFRIYNSTNSELTNSFVTDIMEDSEGFIWIATNDGLNKYDWETEKFYNFKNDPNNPSSLSNNLVYTVFEDNSHTVWIGTLNGLNKYNREKNNFTVIKQVSNRLNQDALNSVISITEDNNDILWIATWNGFTGIDKNGEIVKTYFSTPAGASSIDYRKISCLFTDKDGFLWLGMNGEGLKRYDSEADSFENYIPSSGPNSISDGRITAFMQDKSGTIWIGTSNGLNKFDTKEKKFISIYNNLNISSSLISNQITSVFEDNTGLIWIGTSIGISKYYRSSNSFKYLQENTKQPEKGLTSSRLITVFIDEKDNIWVGTMDGLNLIKNGSEEIVHFTNKPGNSNSISSNFVRTILVDSEGIVWIGTNDNGLNKYDPVSRNFDYFNHDGNDSLSISNNGVISSCEDNDGNLWFGTWWGLNKFDKKTEKFTRFLANPNDTNSINNSIIWDIEKDPEGMLWVGTDGGGVSRLNPETGKITTFSDDTSRSNRYISSSRVFSIESSSKGEMWFGTSNGLNKYNLKTKEIKTYTQNNGLPSNLINSIQLDNNGDLWIGTDRGLAMLESKSDKIFNYTKRNGLRSLEFDQFVSAKSKDGTLYFGSVGLIYFNPNNIKIDSLKAPVVFTDLKIYNESISVSDESILKKSINASKEIFIPPGNDVITIEFALLDYFEVSKNTFQYYLEGFDVDWNNVGTRNYATYTNLSPGEYKFYVKATNNNGYNNYVKSSLNIIILPRFYQTWWFQTLGIAVFIIFIVLIIQLRTKTITNRNKLLEERVKERTENLNQRTKDLHNTVDELNQEIELKNKFFSIIAHDLRSPFTATLGFSQHLLHEVDNISKEDLKVVAESISKSTKLTFDLLENLLDWGRIQTGRMEYQPKDIELTELVNKSVDIFKHNIKEKNISLSVKLESEPVVFADPNMLNTVLRNLISNAIKFTDSLGTIIITVTEDTRYAIIKIKDSGIGIPQDKIDRLFKPGQNISTPGTQNEKGSGLGLILCKEFIEFNKGEMIVSSKVGEGSEFGFLLPKVNGPSENPSV